MKLLLNLDRNRVTGLVLVDYGKAFDMVDHAILLNKLKIYVVDDYTLKWFKSFLTDRKQFVSLAGNDSDMADMKHGVPRGNTLGPLLFIVFIKVFMQ